MLYSTPRYYFAAVTHTDELLGTVLDAVTELGIANNTIVAFWGDHGWHLSGAVCSAECAVQCLVFRGQYSSQVHYILWRVCFPPTNFKCNAVVSM